MYHHQDGAGVDRGVKTVRLGGDGEQINVAARFAIWHGTFSGHLLCGCQQTRALQRHGEEQE